MPDNMRDTRGQRAKGRHPTHPRAPAEGTDSGHGSRLLTDTFIVEEERNLRVGTNQWVEAPQATEQMEV